MAVVPAENSTQELPDTILKRYRYSKAICETYRTIRHQYYISLNEFENEVLINRLAPSRTAQLTSRRCILNIYSTNILT